MVVHILNTVIGNQVIYNQYTLIVSYQYIEIQIM